MSLWDAFEEWGTNTLDDVGEFAYSGLTFAGDILQLANAQVETAIGGAAAATGGAGVAVLSRLPTGDGTPFSDAIAGAEEVAQSVHDWGYETTAQGLEDMGTAMQGAGSSVGNMIVDMPLRNFVPYVIKSEEDRAARDAAQAKWKQERKDAGVHWPSFWDYFLLLGGVGKGAKYMVGGLSDDAVRTVGLTTVTKEASEMAAKGATSKGGATATKTVVGESAENTFVRGGKERVGEMVVETVVNNKKKIIGLMIAVPILKDGKLIGHAEGIIRNVIDEAGDVTLEVELEDGSTMDVPMDEMADYLFNEGITPSKSKEVKESGPVFTPEEQEAHLNHFKSASDRIQGAQTAWIGVLDESKGEHLDYLNLLDKQRHTKHRQSLGDDWNFPERDGEFLDSDESARLDGYLSTMGIDSPYDDENNWLWKVPSTVQEA